MANDTRTYHVECQNQACGQAYDQVDTDQPASCRECGSFSVTVDGFLLCPGCGGIGVLTDDPQVFRCQNCSGVFTNPKEPITREQAGQFVALHLPMVLAGEAIFGPRPQFYFDLDLIVEHGTQTRLHGWADQQTKRIVQWG